jgi:hypothetical protein
LQGEWQVVQLSCVLLITDFVGYHRDIKTRLIDSAPDAGGPSPAAGSVNVASGSGEAAKSGCCT